MEAHLLSRLVNLNMLNFIRTGILLLARFAYSVKRSGQRYLFQV